MSTEKKKRPLILHVFHGFRVGGTEVRTIRIINGLKNRYRHIIFSINGNFDARGLIDPGVDVLYFTYSSFSRYDFINWFKIVQILVRTKPDLLIAYAWGAVDWILVNVLLRRTPMIHAADGFDDSEVFVQKKRRVILRQILFRTCNKVVVCSKTLERICYELWKLNQSNVLYIPNGIDLSRFPLALNKKNRCVGEHHSRKMKSSPILIQDINLVSGERGQNSCNEMGHREYVKIGIVASLIKLKNHKRLLDCFAQLVKKINALLFIIGDGGERKKLEAYSRELDIDSAVCFMGYLSEPAQVLPFLNIFCLSSDTEQAPMVVLEAMASGLPIVSTDVGDIKDMVSRENRPFVVSKKDKGTYLQSMLCLAEDRELRERIGWANQLKCACLYDERRMVKRYDTLYMDVIGPKSL